MSFIRKSWPTVFLNLAKSELSTFRGALKMAITGNKFNLRFNSYTLSSISKPLSNATSSSPSSGIRAAIKLVKLSLLSEALILTRLSPYIKLLT